MTVADQRPAAARHRQPERRATGHRGATVVGVLGEVLITLGVLLALFVVWQLWWTDVAAGADQRRAIADLDWVVSEPEARDEAETETETTGPRYDEPAPVMAEPANLTTFATLQVPRFGPDFMPTITQGTSRPDVLDKGGLGHYEGTAMPGQIGNFAVAGHRTTYGKPLNRAAELQVGDPLIVQTPDAWYVYRVTGHEIVLPHQVEVVAPVPNNPGATPTVASMTLTTCHPMFSARERYVVHSELDYWMPVSDGVPPDLVAPADPSGGA
ncbi:class E sortase [Actinotalea sp. JY-7885]|uniref:class E sortase n=1 Tax=Actinotalea sp. JY-7885 TaxID=2758576 RepID=UPI00165E8912|nr:class E sortase [Actinotalea sp. JY-7885]